MKTISAAEMREIDRRTMEEFNIPGDVLMERAGQGVANITLDLLQVRATNSVLLIAGPGNNGGDVFAAASFLADANAHVQVWICGSRAKIKGDAEYHLKKMIRRGIQPIEISNVGDLMIEYSPAIIVDGLLGTGAQGAPRGFMSRVIEFINREAHRSTVLSIDIPSGIDADTGIAEGVAVRANITATICLPKIGLIRPEARPYVGAVEIIDIGVPASLKEDAHDCPDAEMIDRSDLILPFRGNESHKGNHGHVLLIGGSTGFTGAIAMAARAALRSGAGLASVLTPEAVYPLVAHAAGPEVMVHPVPDIGTLDLDFSKDWKNVTSVVIGPGMGRQPEIVDRLLQTCPVPVVLDADALCVEPEQIAAAKCQAVLTPHPGEFERLFGEPITDRWKQARSAADRTGKTVVLKGAGTVVANSQHKLGINMSGNPGMATGGSGDVLAGIIAALLGRGMPPFDAAIAGVYLHGVAGDIAAADLTQESMIATDIIHALPDAFRIIQLS